MVDTKNKIMGKIDDAADKTKEWAHEVGDKACATATEPEGSTAGCVVDAVKEKVHDVATGASELASKAKDTAQEWASSVGDAAVQAKDKAQEWASSAGDAAVQAKDKAQEVASVAAEKVGDLVQDVTALIRRHPLPSLLVGVGVGFVLGQVLLRSSSRGE